MKLFQDGMSFRKIGLKLNRHHSLISKFVNDPFDYGMKVKKTGKKPKLNNREKRSAIFAVGVRGKSLREAARDSLASVSHETIWRVMQKTNYRYDKLKKQVKLSADHKKKRMIFAKETLKLGAERFNDIIFSDEKRFNIDGPDGYRYYWHDLRTEKKIYSRSKYIAGIMVWGAISYSGPSAQVFLNCYLNSKNYIELLDEALLPIFDKEVNLFQQDNAPAHSSKLTNQWFIDNNVTVLKWPANSPDLNLIENVWGILARRIYKNNTRFENIFQLKEALIKEWANLEESIFINLYKSFSNRLCDILVKKGNVIPY